jgi:hypothetical protein
MKAKLTFAILCALLALAGCARHSTYNSTDSHSEAGWFQTFEYAGHLTTLYCVHRLNGETVCRP